MKRILDWFLCRDLEPIQSDTPIGDALLAEPRFREIAHLVEVAG